MKRAAILLCLLLLTGCGSDAVPAIEEEAWQMTTVQSTADNGAIIACAPGEPAPPTRPSGSRWSARRRTGCSR